jgi:quinol monooxygenase YgiN
MIIATFVYQLKPGQRDAFVAAARNCGLLTQTPQEPGNLQYQFFLSPDDPDQVFCIERWSATEHLESHRKTTHVAAYQAVKAKYVETVEKHSYTGEELK